MAISLTRVTSSFPLLLSAARNFSARPNTSSNRVGFESTEPEPDSDRTSIQKLEDAVHRVVVMRSQPDWLPFRPGSSYWVPPKSQARGFAHVMTQLANSVAADPALAVVSARGWPSSDYFISESAPSKTELETISTLTTQSEDDEG